MINPVTPWMATVQADIGRHKHISELSIENYNIKLFNTGDSIWLVSTWPNGGRIAFRLAFGMNSNFEKVNIDEKPNEILVTATTRLGYYRMIISIPANEKAVFRYTTSFRGNLPILIPFWPRDIVPLTKEGNVQNTAGIIHAHQVGTRSGQLYFSMTKPTVGSVFYFQNLTAISAYCQATEASLRETVGGNWPEIGFQLPINAQKPLPADTEYILSDAFVLLDQHIPVADNDIATKFLDHLSSIYTLIPKPEPKYHDWIAIAKNVMNDLYHNKGCWTQTNGIPFLNAYVADYETPSEIMVQLAVLLPLQEYLTWDGSDHPLFNDLDSGLKVFYDEQLKTIVRWHPALEDKLDKSEEQKREMVMDSWYLHHPLLNLARLALRGGQTARKLFLDSVDYAIHVARHFEYNWPVFYKMTTLEVLKAETSPGKGGEKDVPGSYAHVMLMAWHLTGEKRFIREAEKALKSLDGLAFDIFYQANNTTFAAGALVEMYKETGESRYLELSYCCLAGIFKNCQIWECDYGYGQNFPYFFGVFPLNDAPYTAAYEELEVFAALHHYLEVSNGIEILPALKILIPEFIKYALDRLAYYFPPMLPREIISEDVKTGEVQNDLWIPLEDLHDGWEKNGTVGQEVYGAGLAFGIVPRQYYRLADPDILIFIDYPVTNFQTSKKSASFDLTGSSRFKCTIRLIRTSQIGLSTFEVRQKNKSNYQTIKEKSPGLFELAGTGTVRITWK